MSINPVIAELVALGVSVVCMAVALALTLRKGLLTPALRLLVILLAAAIVASVVRAAGVLGGWPASWGSWAEHSFFYTQLVVGVLFFQVMWAGLLLPQPGWPGWIGGAIWLVAFIVLDSGQLAIEPIVARWTWLGGWAAFLFGSLGVIVWKALREKLSTSRIQLLYWLTALLLVAAGNMLWLLSGQGIWNATVLPLGILLLAYILMATRLLDFLRLVRRVAVFLIFVLLSTGLFAAAFSGLLALLPDHTVFQPLWLGVALAALLSVLYRPLWAVAYWLLDFISPASHYDTNRILREYSLSISNILDPDRLATVAIGLISEAIEVQRGSLFLVTHEQNEKQNTYRLRGVRGMGENTPTVGVLEANSPIAVYFRLSRRPLMQYDIDYAPDFQSAGIEEREWFTGLKTELYVPIYVKEEWIGLLALGAKSSGKSFREEDILLVSIFSDQTAVAIQNSRLVESLMRVNNEFRRAYSSLESSNRQLGIANTQLEKLDRAKTDFIAIASHELRTPLTVIRGSSEMLMDDPALKGNPYHAKLLDKIHTGVMRMHDIVDVMLDIASIDNRTLNLHMESVSIYTTLQMVCGAVAKPIKERKQSLELADLHEMPAVEVDPETIHKAFFNIVANAIKFTPDDGKITITGRQVPAAESKLDEDSIEISISDTGIGIDAQYHELIFEKFYQTGEIALHSTGKFKFKGGGPGLGLTIAKGIIEAHAGKIWVESPGKNEETCPGSKFTVALPLKQKPRA